MGQTAACFGDKLKRARHGIKMQPRLLEFFEIDPRDKFLCKQNVIANGAQREID